jgi:hypothetical protein
MRRRAAMMLPRACSLSAAFWAYFKFTAKDGMPNPAWITSELGTAGLIWGGFCRPIPSG